jgi:hypothetical protein
MTVVQSGIPEAYELPEIVGRRMVARLSNKYGVRVEFFYHPELLIPHTGAKH